MVIIILVFIAALIKKTPAKTLIACTGILGATIGLTTNYHLTYFDKSSALPLANILKEKLHDGDMVVAYESYWQDLPVYLKQNIIVAGWKGEMGFNFQQQNRADDTRQNSYSLRIAEIFAWRVWEKLTADLKVEFFPNLDEFGEYRLRLESTLRYPVSKRLSLNLDVIDLYDTRPPAEVSKNDLQIRSTIGVTF